MDLSKLPRLSETNKEQPPPAEAGQPAMVNPAPIPAARYAGPVDAGNSADAWIAIGVGALVVLMSTRILKYVFSSSDRFAQQFSFTVNGQLTPYTHTYFFWSDLSLVSFGLAMIVEGLVLAFARKAGTVMIALSLTILATAINAIFLVAMMVLPDGFGLQIFSALAVVFGVYIAMYQWNLLKAFRASR
jgi:hypothetical protein